VIKFRFRGRSNDERAVHRLLCHGGGDDPGFDYVETKMSLVDPPLFYLLIGRLRNRSRCFSRTPRYPMESSFPVVIKQGTSGTACLLLLVTLQIDTHGKSRGLMQACRDAR
jgi:hypothetical protein